MNEHTFEAVTRWQDLTWEEKRNYDKAVYMLGLFFDDNDNVDLAWSTIDSTLGIKHLYRFSLDNLTKEMAKAGKTLYFDDKGLHLNKMTRRIIA